MELWEAVKSLQEGKRVRQTSWAKDDYIYLDKDVGLMDKTGRIISTSIERILFKDIPWEEYKEWTLTGRRSTEVREIVWVKCPYCLAELERTAHNGLVKMYKYCPVCGRQVK